MRKLMLILLVAVMTAPAMAAVTISVASNGDINYACDGVDADVTETYALMAGVAIIVSVDAGDTITDVTPTIDGPSVSGAAGYGVFMKTAQIGGDPLDWIVDAASPIATVDSPGEVGGINENQITLEFGALYDADTDAPLASGTLCTITIGDGATSAATLALEDVARGGIVMEGGAAPSEVILIGGPISGGGPCYEGMADFAEWEDAGSPDCWCYPTQCKGDANGQKQGVDTYTGNPGYYVGNLDINILAGAWQEEPITGDNGCADFNHARQGVDTYTGNPGYRVGNLDINILAANWQDADLATDCLPGNVIP